MLTGTTRRRCAAVLSVPLLLALVVVHAATRTQPTSAQRTVAAQTASAAAPVRHAATVEPAAVSAAPDLHWDLAAALPELSGVPLPHGVTDAAPSRPSPGEPATPLTREGRAPPA
ncbi:hypothetical protein [Aeromicrobium sp. IC_218]|uniref:hypothetical protein n=1 Tax=Aeromicrobium sp. IC_218 TaxID=2545468 RepID=UPI00103BA160|nr:hypothetical protein [Aeromicrobium sp. IC_218]TCI99814.1 hypothetical protein E0W78_05260 [Aeromicrobium sp. IC_218]